MARYFTLTEAERLLPELERLLQRLIDSKRDYDAADSELTGIAERIALTGGMAAPRERIAGLRARKDASARTLKAAVEQIQEIGCELKDVETGLIDFPTRYKGQEVYLCWKLGESAIGFWHPVADGFRGRRPIDDDFLANHRGSSSS